MERRAIFWVEDADRDDDEPGLQYEAVCVFGTIGDGGRRLWLRRCRLRREAEIRAREVNSYRCPLV